MNRFNITGIVKYLKTIEAKVMVRGTVMMEILRKTGA